MSLESLSSFISLFNQQFLASYNTELVSALECLENPELAALKLANQDVVDEPIYLPADETYPHHRIVFAHGYLSSALHEISHWCIAGDARRLLVDFGYWYEPDGRSPEQQRLFESVEIKPQAIEWVLSKACGLLFHLSTDNLSGDLEENEKTRQVFADNVHQQVQKYLKNGLPERANVLKDLLLDYYRPLPKLGVDDFSLNEL